jgi:hypothetical protein
VKAARIEQPRYSLPDREPSARVLALDPLGPAHAPRQLLTPAQLLELGFPLHRVSI